MPQAERELSVTVITTGYAPVEGARLYYEQAGAGEAIVLVHAGLADSRVWDEHVDPLAAHHQIIRYDVRGFGRSAMPDGAFAHHEDLYRLLNILGVEQATLVGASMGGGVAIGFALEHPNMVRGLVLVNATVPGQEWSEAVERFGVEEEEMLERGDLDMATELNLRMWMDGPHRAPEQVDAVTRERVRTMQRHAFTLLNPNAIERQLDPPALSRVGELRCPVLVIVGDEDVEDIPMVARRLADDIPHARLERIAGAAHLPSMERPEEFRHLLLPFLKSVSA